MSIFCYLQVSFCLHYLRLVNDSLTGVDTVYSISVPLKMIHPSKEFETNLTSKRFLARVGPNVGREFLFCKK